MRRIFLLAVGALALALAVPSIAAAHGRHHRHHHHHHHAKAHHARLEHFGGTAGTSPSGDRNGPGDAGTVASFTDGVLTIALADGSTVSGKVTSDTEINCMGPSATASRDGSEDQGDQGDDNGQGDDDNQGDQQDRPASCDATDLVAGTPVHEATLKISSSGATFKLVLLDQSSQQQAGS